MYARHYRFLPLFTTTAVLVSILMMVSTMQIQRVYSLGVVHMRLPSTRRKIAFVSTVNCPYTTCSRATTYTDRRRRRQNQGVDYASRALFASSSSPTSSPGTTGMDSIHNKSGIRLVLDTAKDTEELGALLCTLLLSEEEKDHQKDSSTALTSTPTPSTHAAAGSVIFIQGDLGAGKTCLARGFVRAAVQDWDERVTSPTYLLSNVYQTGQNLE